MFIKLNIRAELTKVRWHRGPPKRRQPKPPELSSRNRRRSRSSTWAWRRRRRRTTSGPRGRTTRGNRWANETVVEGSSTNYVTFYHPHFSHFPFLVMFWTKFLSCTRIEPFLWLIFGWFPSYFISLDHNSRIFLLFLAIVMNLLEILIKTKREIEK